jgi:hypothetical protein
VSVGVAKKQFSVAKNAFLVGKNLANCMIYKQ